MGSGPQSRRADAIRAVELFLLQKVGCSDDPLTLPCLKRLSKMGIMQMMFHAKDEVAVVLVGTQG